jgi:hypothetical protein
MGEALRFSAEARLIAGLDRQLRRIKCQGHDLLLDGKVTPTDIDDLPLITAVHESLFTWDGNVVWEAACPFPAQQQVEDHGPPSWASVVLNQAEFVVLGIGHDDDDPFVVLVPLAGEASVQGSDDVDCIADVIDRNVQMDTDFACLRLGDRLEYQPRLGVVTLAEVNPTGLGRAGFATEQGAPKPGYTLWVETVDSHARPNVHYSHHPWAESSAATHS